MTVLVTWLATLGSALLGNIQQFLTTNAPTILSNLFAGKIPAGVGASLLAELESVGLSKVADLGLTEYMHTYVKDADNFTNNACSKNGSQQNLYAVLSIFVTHGAVATAVSQVLVAREYLQWGVASAQNASPASATALQAARDLRDACQADLEALTALQLVELAGTAVTVPTLSKATLDAISAVNALLATPPTATSAAPAVPAAAAVAVPVATAMPVVADVVMEVAAGASLPPMKLAKGRSIHATGV